MQKGSRAWPSNYFDPPTYVHAFVHSFTVSAKSAESYGIGFKSSLNTWLLLHLDVPVLCSCLGIL